MSMLEQMSVKDDLDDDLGNLLTRLLICDSVEFITKFYVNFLGRSYD